MRKVKDNDGSLQNLATRVTARKEKIVTASPVRLCLNHQQKEFRETAATAEQQEWQQQKEITPITIAASIIFNIFKSSEAFLQSTSIIS